MMQKSFTSILSRQQMVRGFATKQPSLKLTNIKSLVGYKRDDTLLQESNCEVLIVGNKIAKIASKITEDADKTLDTNQALVTPSFIDPHTHMYPPQDRSNQYAFRGIKTIAEIKAEGGGIAASVKAAREATFEQIYEVNERNVKRYIQQGTATVEIKSGYGLNLDTEIMILEVINALKKKYKPFIDIIPTFMGAHDFPIEYKDNPEKQKEYVNLLIKEMIPAIRKKRLAEFCDIYCAKGYFSVQQAEKVLKKAISRKLKARMHVDEFEETGAVQLAADLKILSADHLQAVSDKGIKALAEAGVIATILPGTTVHLGLRNFAPGRKMIDMGCRVAIGTNNNPGTSVNSCQPLMMNYAIGFAKLTVNEAFKGVTRNAALSLGRENKGIIDEDAHADLLVWNGIDTVAQIPYYHLESTRFISKIIKNGKVLNMKRLDK